MILLAPLNIIDQNNEKNTIFLHFWIQVYPDAQKITHQKVNFWKNSIVVNKFGSNFHVICQSLRDTVDQSSDFFYGSNFSEVIWHSAQITKLFWIQNNVFSSMYTWKKKKFNVIYSQNGYTLVKNLKIAKTLIWKKYLAYSHGNIYWCSKCHMRKSDNFRKPLFVLANLFLIIMWTVRH